MVERRAVQRAHRRAELGARHLLVAVKVPLLQQQLRRDLGAVMDVLHDAWSDCACVDVRPVWFVGFEICLFKTSQG